MIFLPKLKLQKLNCHEKFALLYNILYNLLIKTIFWLGSSFDDLLKLSKTAKQNAGYNLDKFCYAQSRILRKNIMIRFKIFWNKYGADTKILYRQYIEEGQQKRDQGFYGPSANPSTGMPMINGAGVHCTWFRLQQAIGPADVKYVF